MAGKLNEAKALCSKSEWALVQECNEAGMSAMPLSRVKRKAAAARRLRDKWRDLSLKQKRDAMDPAAAERSRVKAVLFGTVLAGIERQVRKLEREALNAAMRKRDRLLRKKPGALKGEKPAGVHSKAGKEAAMKKKVGTPKKIQGHISSRNKRNQAKRDSR